MVKATLPVRLGVKLPAGGLRIVHLTDLHLRDSMPGTAICEWLARRLEADPPDLLVFTGDFCDDKFASSRQVKHALAFVERLAPLARFGTFGVNGNHDGDLVAARLESVGLRPMDGEQVRIEVRGVAVDLIGLAGTWRGDWPGFDDLDRDPTTATIVLGHYPDEIRRCDRLSPDVYFAGHTHGGQIALPWRPIITHDELPYSKSSGVHEMKGTWLVVSRGVGTTRLPIRMFAPGEVVEAKLVTA